METPNCPYCGHKLVMEQLAYNSSPTIFGNSSLGGWRPQYEYTVDRQYYCMGCSTRMFITTVEDKYSGSEFIIEKDIKAWAKNESTKKT